jgi:hypothetical protein
VFELSRTAKGGWAERILHSFGSGKDGPYPSGGVVFDKAGNLYGVTEGIQGSCAHAAGSCGAVYELLPTASGPWQEKVLHYFSFNAVDGYAPAGKLLIDSDGNLFGGTIGGGAFYNGIAYKLIHGSNGWAEKILYTFYWGKGGGVGPAGLARDAQGNLYGAAPLGADGWGQVFQLMPTASGAWNFQTLHTFNASALDGGTPNAGIIVDPTDGSLIGTTQYGGSGQASCITWGGGNESASCGVVYRLTLVGNGTWNETILHNFGDSTDGWVPQTGVVRDHSGNLFGTTAFGGSGPGTVYEVMP